MYLYRREFKQTGHLAEYEDIKRQLTLKHSKLIQKVGHDVSGEVIKETHRNWEIFIKTYRKGVRRKSEQPKYLTRYDKNTR